MNQQVQDGRDHLLSDHGSVDFNGWEMRMREHHWNMEAADVGVIVWGDTAVIGKGETTVLVSMGYIKVYTVDLLITCHYEQGLVDNTLLGQNVDDLLQPVVDISDRVQILVDVLIGVGVLG